MDPFENWELISEFCYQNDLDFDLWLSNKGIDARFAKQENYHLSYCEANAAEFLAYSMYRS